MLVIHEGVSLNRWLSVAVATYAGTGHGGRLADPPDARRARRGTDERVEHLALVSETPGDYVAPVAPTEE